MVMERVSVKPRSSQPERLHTNIKRGDILFADLRGGNGGSEQTGQRAILVISNNRGNMYSPTLITVALTTSESKAKLPTHVLLEARKTGLRYDSIALCETIKTIDEYRIISKVGTLDEETATKIDKALAISIGLDYLFYR
jgi:mRNA interferase MazF